MKVTPAMPAGLLVGHKTEAIYRRHAIVSEADLSEGVAKLARLQQEREPVEAQGKIFPLQVTQAGAI